MDTQIQEDGSTQTADINSPSEPGKHIPLEVLQELDALVQPHLLTLYRDKLQIPGHLSLYGGYWVSPQMGVKFGLRNNHGIILLKTGAVIARSGPLQIWLLKRDEYFTVGLETLRAWTLEQHGKPIIQQEHPFHESPEKLQIAFYGVLRKAIEHEAAKMLTPNELFPAEWWAVKQRLGAMKEHGENYLSDERYENLCRELKVAGKDSEVLLRRLSDLGTVVSFPDRQLRELAVLNPEWVTGGIYRVLNDDRLREQRHGQLAWCELTRILPADLWAEKRHRFLVELMRKFELCFPLEGESETELVPELLPDKTPSLDDWNPAECLVFLYQYPVLPYGVLPRFITRTHSKSRGRDRWRSGVVLAREGAEAVVRADYDKNQVIVWVRGRYADGRRSLLTVSCV